MHVATTKALREIVMALYDQQDADWSPEMRDPSRKVSSTAEEVKRLLAQSWHPLTRKQLEKLLSTGNELHVDFIGDKNRIMYLPPLEKDGRFVPVLSLVCNLDERREELRLRVLLISKDDNDDLQGIGFRLETPEWQNEREQDPETAGRGRHDFYHAQWIPKLDMNPPLPRPIMWIPCNQPSFPLAADCPVTLVLTLILSLYGKKYYGDFMNRHKSQDLARYRRRVDEWIGWPSD